MEQLPAGVWGIGYKPMIGTPYFYKMDYHTEHGKIYGKAEDIASHVIKAFESVNKSKNLGVLFSGKKGLGKSFTIKLIVEKLVDKYPVVIVNKYTKLIPEILTHMHNSVIVFDEFEKITRESSGDEGTKPQETLLSVLDGSLNLNHNLFLLSINKVNQLDEHLLSRPGRIKYHYRFNSLDKSTIKDYCADNLIATRTDDVEAIINTIGGSSVQSLDILQAIVEEANAFPELPIKDIANYMNINEVSDSVIFKVVMSYQGHQFVVEQHEKITLCYDGKYDFWIGDIFISCAIPPKILSYVDEFLPLEKIKIVDVSNRVDIYNYDRNDSFWESLIDDDGDIQLERPSKDDFAIESISVRKDIASFAF
jgi:hypothetical protein